MPNLLLTISAIDSEASPARTQRNAATATRRNGGRSEGAAYAVLRDSTVIEQRVIYTGPACLLPLGAVAACYCFGSHDVGSGRAASTHSTLLQGGYATSCVPVTHTDYPQSNIYITFQWLADDLSASRASSPKTGINARI